VIVLDASALVDVVLDQAPKRTVAAHLAQPISAPSHQPAEVLSAVARRVRAGEASPEVAMAALQDVVALDQHLVIPTERHLRRALELQDRIRVVDGLYVALAEELGVPLVTTDARLVGSDPPCDLIYAGV
jgi:predicted nucleic acid-binding protein